MMPGEKVGGKPEWAPIAAILAGGHGTRLGGIDKALLDWAGEPLVRRVGRRLRPHCRRIVVIANGDLGRFQSLGLAAIADRTDLPLAGARLGLATAFGLLDRACADDLLLTTPTDLPDLPFDLVWRLKEALAEAKAPAACAASGERMHPLVGLWTARGAERALAHLAAYPDGSATLLHRAIGSAIARYPARPQDPFHNVNRPEDLRRGGRYQGGGNPALQRT